MFSAENIKKTLHHIGFDMCGIARCEPLVHEKEFFDRWLTECGCGGLDYLERNVEMRFDASKIMEGAKSVIVCAVGYKNDSSLGMGESEVPKIASYARNADYHRSIRNMLHTAADLLEFKEQGIAYRTFCDSAPVAEKSWAVRAGVGWIGRNSLLITRTFGSFIHLGEIVCSAEMDVYDLPSDGDPCHGCNRCILRCPKGAIDAKRRIDAGRCISRMTVEKGDMTDSGELHGWIFGCDECQSVCPYNRTAPQATNPAFKPLFDPRTVSADDWRRMSAEEFEERFGSTPMARSGLERIVRNL